MPQQPAFARDNWFGTFAPPAPPEPAVEVDADRERDPEADTDEYDAVSETVEAERDSVVELPGQGDQPDAGARIRRLPPARLRRFMGTGATVLVIGLVLGAGVLVSGATADSSSDPTTVPDAVGTTVADLTTTDSTVADTTATDTTATDTTTTDTTTTDTTTTDTTTTSTDPTTTTDTTTTDTTTTDTTPTTTDNRHDAGRSAAASDRHDAGPGPGRECPAGARRSDGRPDPGRDASADDEHSVRADAHAEAEGQAEDPADPPLAGQAGQGDAPDDDRQRCPVDGRPAGRDSQRRAPIRSGRSSRTTRSPPSTPRCCRPRLR